jgi:phosphatidylserine decarboxylase
LPYRLLYILPKNLLSHTLGLAVHARLPFGLHKVIKSWFIRQYKLDCDEAEYSVENYETLGDLFVRKLKAGARQIASRTLISPVDGTLTQGGRFKGQQPILTQIKGMNYQLLDLVGPDWNLEDYLPGGYLTIYLAPHNYHRIHSPLDGLITQVTYIPGALWPVNTWSVSHVPGLFVVNERIVVEVSGPGGKALVVMVGATNVGRITLDFYPGIVGNCRPQSLERVWRPEKPLAIAKGQGLGCFELGSTVILILSKNLAEQLDPNLLSNGDCIVRMGQGLTP